MSTVQIQLPITGRKWSKDEEMVSELKEMRRNEKNGRGLRGRLAVTHLVFFPFFSLDCHIVEPWILI